jgi:hypothetical protein
MCRRPWWRRRRGSGGGRGRGGRRVCCGRVRLGARYVGVGVGVVVDVRICPVGALVGPCSSRPGVRIAGVPACS